MDIPVIVAAQMFVLKVLKIIRELMPQQPNAVLLADTVRIVPRVAATIREVMPRLLNAELVIIAMIHVLAEQNLFRVIGMKIRFGLLIRNVEIVVILANIIQIVR